ncbi:MAG: hypothetical protein AABX04_06145 [Nanoarchaeota archaeon]
MDHWPFLNLRSNFYPDHSPEKAEFFAGLARKLGMIATGGSDHHEGERDRLGTVDVPDYVAGYFK